MEIDSARGEERKEEEHVEPLRSTPEDEQPMQARQSLRGIREIRPHLLQGGEDRGDGRKVRSVGKQGFFALLFSGGLFAKPVGKVKKQRAKKFVSRVSKEDGEALGGKEETSEEVGKRGTARETIGGEKKQAKKEKVRVERKMEKVEEREIQKGEKRELMDVKTSESEPQPEVVTLVVRKQRKPGGISGFLRSLNYIGMGGHRIQFIQNLAMMLSAGLPLTEALSAYQLEVRHRAMRKVVRRITEAVESGHPLWRAMEDTFLFSPYIISLVRVGEEAGRLARNLEYLTEQQEKDRALRAKVQMAMIYPSIVMVLMLGVVIGLGMFVLPNLVQVLFALQVDLPLMTRIVIAVSNFFQQHGARAVPALVGGLAVLFVLTTYTPLRIVSQWVIFHIPGIGRLAKEATIARFGVILGGLLQSGVPLVESLQSLEEATTVHRYRRFYGKLVDRIATGDSFATCFREIRGSRKVLPGPVQQLIITGEKSGTLSETFLNVAKIYDRKAEETAKKLPIILEPMLLLIIGGLVAVVAFSIILPIYKAVGSIGRG